MPDPGESGISGVTVALYVDADGDMLLSGADALATAVITGPAEQYSFTDLLGSNYLVDVTDTAGILNGFQLSSAGAIGPDPLPVSLVYGESFVTADFGCARARLVLEKEDLPDVRPGAELSYTCGSRIRRS